MSIYGVNTLLEGEQKLAKNVLDVLPLIEKHFAPFEGKSINIQNGYAAKFRNAIKAFREECHEVSEMFRIGVDGDRYVGVKFEVTVSHGCTNYFSEYVYFGEVVDDEFKYNFTDDDLIKKLEKILDTTVSDLENVNAEYEKKKKELEAIKDTVPSCFRDIFR